MSNAKYVETVMQLWSTQPAFIYRFASYVWISCLLTDAQYARPKDNTGKFRFDVLFDVV